MYFVTVIDWDGDATSLRFEPEGYEPKGEEEVRKSFDEAKAELLEGLKFTRDQYTLAVKRIRRVTAYQLNDEVKSRLHLA